MRVIETDTQWVGLGDVATIFGVSNSTVSNWVRRDPTFPAPVFRVSSWPVWRVKDVVAWGVSAGRFKRGEVTIHISRQVL